MKYKFVLPAILVALAFTTYSDAQVIIGGGIGPRPYGYPHRRPYPQRPPQRQPQRRTQPYFEPSLNLSIGYGFPALDKNNLPDYYEAYKGNVSQTGPINASLDYHFTRGISLGVMASYNKVTSPYYHFNDDAVPSFTAKLDNWSVMFNMMSYFGYSQHVSPYLRTAIGVNSWKQTYTAPDGTKPSVEPADLPDLAYQVSLGVKFQLSKNAGLFMEAGYGKYIFNGGLAFKL